MKIQWEFTDVWKGRRVWRDLECIIATTDGYTNRLVVLVVLENGRIMVIGTEEEVAKYMTENDYLPYNEKVK